TTESPRTRRLQFALTLTASIYFLFFFFQAEDGIRDPLVTGVQTCALPICRVRARSPLDARPHHLREHGVAPPPRAPRLRGRRRRVGGRLEARPLARCYDRAVSPVTLAFPRTGERSLPSPRRKG